MGKKKGPCRRREHLGFGDGGVAVAPLEDCYRSLTAKGHRIWRSAEGETKVVVFTGNMRKHRTKKGF